MQEIKRILKENSDINKALLMSNLILNSKSIKDEKDRELLLLLLQDRDRNFIRLNDNDEIFENIKYYLSLLRPLALDEKDLIRIGGNTDGGYVMYNDLRGGGVGSFLRG